MTRRPAIPGRTYGASVGDRGRVTIPAAVRERLGIARGARVRFREVDGAVVLEREPFTIETAFGSVTPINRPEDFDQLIEAVMDEHAARVLEKMREN